MYKAKKRQKVAIRFLWIMIGATVLIAGLPLAAGASTSTSFSQAAPQTAIEMNAALTTEAILNQTPLDGFANQSSSVCGMSRTSDNLSNRTLTSARNIRTGPSLDCSKVGTLNPGVVFTTSTYKVVDRYRWAHVETSAGSGWVAYASYDGSNNLLATAPTNSVCGKSRTADVRERVITSARNIRTGPSLDCPKVGTLNPNVQFTSSKHVTGDGYRWTHVGAGWVAYANVDNTNFLLADPPQPAPVRQRVGSLSNVEYPKHLPVSWGESINTGAVEAVLGRARTSNGGTTSTEVAITNRRSYAMRVSVEGLKGCGSSSTVGAAKFKAWTGVQTEDQVEIGYAAQTSNKAQFGYYFIMLPAKTSMSVEIVDTQARPCNVIKVMGHTEDSKAGANFYIDLGFFVAGNSSWIKNAGTVGHLVECSWTASQSSNEAETILGCLDTAIAKAVSNAITGYKIGEQIGKSTQRFADRDAGESVVDNIFMVSFQTYLR